MRRHNNSDEPHIPVVPFMDCPAKTYEDEYGQTRMGRSVFEHCLIVGELARALLKRLPVHIREGLFPPGSALIAAVHDVGKVSPTFFLKLQKAVSGGDSPCLKAFESYFGIDEYQWGGHAGVSALTLIAAIGRPDIGIIAGQHHGYTSETGNRDANATVLGGEVWQQQRIQLIEALMQALQETWPMVAGIPQLRVLAGLTSVADWIGSGYFFERPEQPWQPQIERALDQAGFIIPMVRKGLTFGDIFKDQDGHPLTPNDSQLILQRHCLVAGVYVLEAPMGLGKTEAALYAAYLALERGEARGIYFALPTQLTSNKIHERFEQFLQTTLEDESPHKHALLLHGSAWLMEHELGEEGRPGGGWFNSSKRGLLAPFAVGTLDQALMAAMHVKHGFVRAFGLAGKVVILDEVHSYDAYTSVILDELIALLRQLDCTVIILSATLSRARRAQLLGQEVTTNHYPLITASPNHSAALLAELPVALPGQSKVGLRLMPMAHEPALEEALNRAQSGQQVLWIENTVQEAQTRYFDFAARCQEEGIDCGLLHSRFTMAHRQCNEDKWIAYYGKQGWDKRAKQGRILIGTQVLEQSLDIDADFLITRFAPTDMLLQRLGRLWRHAATPRASSALREVWILAPEYHAAVAQPQAHFGATASVYASYILCRTLEVWGAQSSFIGHVVLPGDIRTLIERTYAERDESAPLAQWKRELHEGTRYRKGLRALQQLARLTLAQQGKTLPESKAQTRYSEQDNADLLLLKAFELDGHEKRTQLTLLDGSRINIPWQRHRLTRVQWRQKAALLTAHLVQCRQTQRPNPPLRTWCEKAGLGNVFYLGHPAMDEAGLSVAVVAPTGELKSLDGSSLSDRFTYRYRHDLGLQINKIKE
ncbi:CRISPR-associated helicase Cas3' [Patescibacteria group bacterium]|nr:CRISPR-associated helicase Cas3' [Patescibacteria group bacterium]